MLTNYAIIGMCLTFLATSHAYTYSEDTRKDVKVNADGSRSVDEYCYIEGYGRIELNVSFRNKAKCVDCTCEPDRLRCHGVGKAGGVYDYEGCIYADTTDCCVKLVKKDDPNEVCYSYCPKEHANPIL